MWGYIFLENLKPKKKGNVILPKRKNWMDFTGLGS